MPDTNDSIDEEREFYIQLIDEESFIAIKEFSIGRWSIREISKKLNVDPDYLKSSSYFILEQDMGSTAQSLFDIDISKEGCEVNLTSWSKTDGLPYRVHSGRELILMRDRAKPLAVFTSMIPEPSDSIALPTHLFDPFVRDGVFACRTYCEPLVGNSRFSGVEVVLYALCGEEWRIDAYMLVRSTARKIGWSEPLTRIEGTLLGYSDWQNDAFIAAGRPDRALGTRAR